MLRAPCSICGSFPRAGAFSEADHQNEAPVLAELVPTELEEAISLCRVVEFRSAV